MQKIVNGIVIEYEKQDEDVVQEIIQKLAEKSQDIMDFFELKEVGDFKIKIWDTLEGFKNHYFQINGEECKDWVNGHTSDGNINMLPVRLASLSEEHKDITNEEVATDACHEFTHICQQNTVINETGENYWFWEALATTLGNPECFWRVKESDFENIKNLKDLKDSQNGCYKYLYLMGGFMIKTLPHKQVLNYVKDERLLEKDSENLLKDAQNYYKNLSKQKQQTEKEL